MCYRPITIKDLANPGHFMQVPCGKCLDCRRKYQNALSNRMYEEFKAKGCKGVFFTLTYDDKHVPKNYFAHGRIYRSFPEYAYTNIWDENRGRARIKFPYDADSVLTANGIEAQNIIDFNAKRNRRDLNEWKELMSELFVKRFPKEFDLPCESKEATSEADANIDLTEYLDTSLMYFNDEDFCDVDKDTGEVVVPVDEVDYQQITKISQWYAENTPIVSFNSVRVEDVQRWLKRNRTREKRSNPEFDFTYFVSSEYGPRTLRPHYHGVLFGVTKDDVRLWFRDWQEHFGEIVTFDNLDTTKGGLSYVAKYCSKGMFEHPLCSRDFYYGASEEGIKEYHSKRYERCIDLFGIDTAFVDPTFHLFSKGLGVDWINHNNLRCEEFEDITRKDLDSSSCNVFIHNFDSSVPFVFRLSADALLSGDFSSISDLIYQAKKYEYQESPYAWLRRFYLRFNYTRVFRVKNKQTGEISERSFAFQVPRYYREKMFGPNLRSSYANFVRAESDRLFVEKLRNVAADQLDGKTDERISALFRQEAEELMSRYLYAFDSQKKFFNKSQL